MPNFCLTPIHTLGLAASLSLALLASANAQVVKLSTSEGDIRIELNAEKAPKSVANFVQYVKAGHYNGTIFHRVIENFMIQGGGFTPKMAQKPTKPPIPLESRNGLLNVRGSVAMARTAVPDSATAQFFINTVDNAFLDADNARDGNGYAVFGQVIEGMDVVDKIRAVPVGNMAGQQNVPNNPVIINKAIVESKK
ncbi:peptidyl-prolyl cis-trans isomerase A (cyclophilin A) [Paucibacter oligotrophus]|uniref:Peptidyl-prolyl cis-trans isomerase n=1 Tax=Roseateles oligotrophus TaxID=1769250 RepID=A0A840L5B3_9BURK|nr:peptidylprolyl isomerase [Roseateles oligotrophus]MBB4841872.1 peptidyl-prolyl cis-trans isomerase A (cyclophilin A) [Roseateles oligotrophus]